MSAEAKTRTINIHRDVHKALRIEASMSDMNLGDLADVILGESDRLKKHMPKPAKMSAKVKQESDQ